jgi:hypothetical protein
MRLKSTRDWERDELALARSHSADYIEVALWMKVQEVAEFEDGPIASIDMAYGVFEFETKKLCVLAIRPQGADPILTHIFLKGGPAEITGSRNRAIAAALAIGVTPFMIVV